MPDRRAAIMMRQAISPRVAIKIRLNIRGRASRPRRAMSTSRGADRLSLRQKSGREVAGDRRAFPGRAGADGPRELRDRAVLAGPPAEACLEPARALAVGHGR